MRSFAFVLLALGLIVAAAGIALSQAPAATAQPGQTTATAVEAQPAVPEAGEAATPEEASEVMPEETPEAVGPEEETPPPPAEEPVMPALPIVPTPPVMPAPQPAPAPQVTPGVPQFQPAPSGPVAPAPEPIVQDNMITLNLPNPVDVSVLLDYVHKLLGINFMYDQSVLQGKIMLMPPQKVAKEKFMPLVEAIFAYNGLVMLPSTDGWMTIHKITDVPHKPSPLVTPEELLAMGETDKVLTVVYKLRYTGAAPVQAAITPMATSQGTVLTFPSANIMLLTDYASNLRRLIKLLQLIDNKETSSQLRIFPLQFASAENLAGQITRVVLAQAAASGATQPQQLANVDFDSNTNQLIATATATDMVTIQELIEALDVAPKTGGRNLRIYALKNAKAKDVATTLEQLSSQLPSGVRTAPGARPGAAPGPVMQAGESNIPVKIVGDETTNSIIVFGPADMQTEIEALILELDRRKAQVLLEALVVQVTGSRNADFGAELEALGKGSPRGLGQTDFNFSTVTDPTTGARTINTGQGITGAIISDDQVPIILRALLTTQNGQVISRPRLLVSDNKEANFASVDQQPTTAINTVTSTTATTSFANYQDAGTTLKITPHISPTGPEAGNVDYLTLETEVEVSQFTGTSTSAEVPPPKRKDSMKSTLQVPDRSTVVVGGLSGYHMTSTVNKVPFLGDIPILGLLFSRTTTTRDDTTEYIFIKAQIARDTNFKDLREMSQQPRERSEAMQRAVRKTAPTIGADQSLEEENSDSKSK
jgi:general secretion pathway protein D